MQSRTPHALAALVAALALLPAAARADEATSAEAETTTCEPGTFGCYLEGDGEWVDARGAYDALVVPRERHYLRAALEEVVFIGIGATWYFLDDTNQLDWDRPPWRLRFTREVVRLDSNGFAINFLWHPLSGVAYYAFPRANGLGVAASAAYGLGACLLWEYGLEFNEKISLNDLVTTPVAGVALGEFFARLGQYLNRAPGGPRRVQRAFGWTLGFAQAVHDAWDHAPPLPAERTADALGYDAAIAHRFDWRAGATVAREGDGAGFATFDVLLDGRLVAIPGHLRPGRFRGYFGDANVTRLHMRAGGGPEGFGFEMDADTVLLGLHANRVRRTEAGPRGVAVVAGTSVGYGYRRDAYLRFEDRVSATRLPGLALDVDARVGRAALHAAARLHGELAGVHAAPFAAWQEAHPDERTKTTLEREGYYYGWGLSESLRLRLELPYFALEGALAHARYASHDGLDRHQEEITLDVEASDRVLDAEIAARFRLARRLGVYAEVGLGRRTRTSRVGELEVERRLDRGFLRVGQVF